MLCKSLRGVFGVRRPGDGLAGRRPGYRPSLESLEMRAVPAALVVGPGGAYPTIGAALTAAKDGDQIQIIPGIYPEGNLAISQNRLTLSVRGNGSVLIDGGGSSLFT